jgi:adenine phosphoribosyltransferase
MNKTTIQNKLSPIITEHPDFPKKGIIFKDLNPIYQNPTAFNLLLDYMQHAAHQLSIFDFIAGIEARGFILGAALAQKLQIGFIPVRKKGKLPGQTASVKYALEYGEDCLEIQDNPALKNARILIIDDIFATGGTLKAVISLLENFASYLAFGIVLDIKIANIKALAKDHFTVL